MHTNQVLSVGLSSSKQGSAGTPKIVIAVGGVFHDPGRNRYLGPRISFRNRLQQRTRIVYQVQIPGYIKQRRWRRGNDLSGTSW